MTKLGRYEILEELGAGAMGRVCKARDPNIDRIVAVKTVRLDEIPAKMASEYRERFFREAKAAGRLAHPGIVMVYDASVDPETGVAFIVMEYVEGSTLLDIGTEGRLTTNEALALVKQLAETLDFAHAGHVVHRDIKPSNILVTSDGRAKIADFGVARLPSSFSLTGQVLGTPSFMAPEQLKGGKADGRADLFSLGMILYWLLTGEQPFPGETLPEVTFKIVYEPMQPASKLNPTLSPDVDYLLEHALAKQPGARYQTGKEMAEDLEDLLAGRPPRSRGKAPTPAAADPLGPVPHPAPGTNVSPAATAARKSGGAEPTTETLHTSPLADHATPAPPTRAPARRFSWKGVAALAVIVAAALLVIFGLRPAGDAETSAGLGSQAEPPAAVAAPLPTATLRIEGNNPLENATLSVYAGGALLRQVALRSGGSFSMVIPVVASRHHLTVRLQEAGGGFDQRQTIEAAFKPDQTRTLRINIARKAGKFWLGREMSLSWKD